MARKKKQTLAITGVGGFIGLRATERALERGYHVRGLELNRENAKRAEAVGAEVLVGDLFNDALLNDTMRGADCVLHTAAIVSEGTDFDLFRRVNVEGAVRAATSARNAGAKIFTHLSSVMVYGFDFPKYITEDGPFRGEDNPYCTTKIESEAAVLKLNEPEKFGVIIIRPGDVYGPGSEPWIVRPLELMRSGLFSLVDGGNGTINHVYIDNLIDAIFLAMFDKPERAFGEAFNVTDGCETTWGEFYDRLADLAGVGKPRRVPAFLIKNAIRAVNAVESLLGRKHLALPAGVDFIRRPHPYSIEKARRLLGYKPAVSLDEGFRRTETWLRGRELV